MSFYATIDGEITYRDQAALDAVVKMLTDGGWFRESNFVDETGGVIHEHESDIDGLTLNIPWAVHRNLTYAFKQMLAGAVSHHIVWSSTDGCFEGGVLKDGSEPGGRSEVTYDLVKWAKDNMDEEDADPPSVDDHENYSEWQVTVQNAFHEEMGR